MTKFKPKMRPATNETTIAGAGVPVEIKENGFSNSRPSNPLKASSSAAFKDEILNLTRENNDLSESNAKLHHSLKQSREEKLADILASRTPVALDPHIIEDEVSSDRISEMGCEDRFLALVEDIGANEQKQPIRVRIRYEGKQVTATHAFLLGETLDVPAGLSFIMQSGRRRRAACIELERKVTAFVSADTKELSPRQDDLLERFRENTLRENLTGWEQLISIAEIAVEFPDKSQAEIGELLSIPRDRVSRAKDAREMEGDLVEFHGAEIYSMSLRGLKALIPKVKRWIEAGRPVLGTKQNLGEKVTTVRETGKAILSNGLTVTASRGGSFKISMTDGSKPGQDQVEWILDAIAKGAGRVK